MKNYVQPGDMITFTAAAALASGAGVLVGALFGVSASDYAAGETNAEMKTTGVFDLAADPAATAAIGAKAYWDDANKRVTATAAGATAATAAADAAAAAATAAKDAAASAAK